MLPVNSVFRLALLGLRRSGLNVAPHWGVPLSGVRCQLSGVGPNPMTPDR